MANEERYGDLTVAELRELARERQIAGASRMRKSDLIAALSPGAAALAESQGASVIAALVDVGSSPAGPPGPVPEPQPAPVSEELYDYPFSYDRDTVVLLARDPQWLFCYWDVCAPTWRELERRGITTPGGGWKPILRLHDVTDNAGQPGDGTMLADLPVFSEARDWYLEAPRPSRTYLVEFGYLSASGEFYRVAISNPAPVPRFAPSTRVEESWGSLTDAAYRLSLAGSDPRTAVGSAELLQRLERLLQEAITSGRFSANIAGSGGGGVWR